MRLVILSLLLSCALSLPLQGAEETVQKKAPPKRPAKTRRFPVKHASPSPSSKPAPKPKPVVTEDDKPPASVPVDAEPTPEPSLPRFDAAWRACKEDKDCIAIDTHCGWGCINGSAEQPASKYYRQLAPFIECAATDEVKPNPICVKKECVCQR
jgi:hypothetical protein